MHGHGVTALLTAAQPHRAGGGRSTWVSFDPNFDFSIRKARASPHFSVRPFLLDLPHGYLTLASAHKLCSQEKGLSHHPPPQGEPHTAKLSLAASILNKCCSFNPG